MKYGFYAIAGIVFGLFALYFYTLLWLYRKYRKTGLSRKQAILATWTMYE